MSKPKNQKVSSEVKPSIPAPTSPTTKWPDLGFIFIFLYLLIEFVPVFQSIDVIGPQWLFLSLLNIIVLIYIFARRQYYTKAIGFLFQTKAAIIYFALLIWALGSFFYAVNSTEVLVNAARLVNTVLVFFNMVILLWNKRENQVFSIQLITLILFFQSLSIVKDIYEMVNAGYGFDGMVIELKGNAGNKNILAAILAIKFSFSLYVIYQSNKLFKVIGFATLLLTVFSIFIINSRTTFISIFAAAFLYLVFWVANFLKERKSRKTQFVSIFLIIAPLLIALYLAQGLVLNIKSATNDTTSTYGTVFDRMKTVYVEATSASGNTRIGFWGHAIDYIKHHPIFGGGLGNWKITSIPYVKELTNDLIVPYHAHNDFLEMAADLGLPGGILFLSLFVLMVYYTARIWRSEDQDGKYIAVFCLIGLSVYFFDAFLNFPAERPATQILFAFILASITSIFITASKEHSSNRYMISPTIYTVVAILMVVPSTYIAFQTYQSMRAQRILATEINNGSPKASLEVVSKLFPSIPNLSVTTLPIEAVKSRYYNRDNRFEKALELLDEGAKANPYLYYSEFLRGAYYYVKGDVDSAYKYTQISFYNWPRAANYFRNYMAVLGLRKDTTEMKKAFTTYIKYRNEAFAWNIYLMGMLQSRGKGDQQLLAITDSILKIFPNNSDLLQRKGEIMATLPGSGAGSRSMSQLAEETAKLYQEGMALFQQQSYEKAALKFTTAASYNPRNYAYFENAGLCFYANKQFAKALTYFNKSIAIGTSVSGKSEYFKGICLVNMGRKKQGCAMVELARAKNYPDADSFLKTYCR